MAEYYQCSSCKLIFTRDDPEVIICCNRRARHFVDFGQKTAIEQYNQEMKIDRGGGFGAEMGAHYELSNS